MHIKVGDIVRYGGANQRLMMRGRYLSRLSTYGVIDNSLCHLDLVESMTLPHLEVGDWVLINNIPIQEKNAYPTPWYAGAVHTVDYIRYSDDYGWLGRIGGYTFHLYHIEPVNSFDII